MLELAEMKAELILDAMLDGVCVSDVNANITQANNSFAKMFGYKSPIEILGKSFFDLIAKRDAQKIIERFLEAVKTKEPMIKNLEVILRRRDGKEFFGVFNIKHLRDEEGEYFSSISVLRDTSERKRMEEEIFILLHDYGERVKELRCLYGISELVARPNISLQEILQGTTDLLLSTWQYPEITCARILVGEQTFETDGFKETQWSQSADIKVDGKSVGSVCVYYLEERPESYEGPFLQEERELINSVADALGGIIERKRIEKMMQIANERWASLTDNTEDTIVITDNKDVIGFINRTIPPTTPEGVIGTSVYEYVSKEQHEVMRKSLKKVYKTGKPDSYEVTLDMSAINPELSTLWFSTKLIPMKTDKEISGVIMIATDITERKKAEEEIRLLSSVVQQTSEAIAVSDLAGKLVFANSAWAEMHGYEVKELTGKDVSIFYQIPETVKLFEAQAQSEGFARGRLRHVKKDGSKFTTLSTLTLLRDEKGVPTGIARITKDIRRIVLDIRDVGLLPKKMKG